MTVLAMALEPDTPVIRDMNYTEWNGGSANVMDGLKFHQLVNVSILH